MPAPTAARKTLAGAGIGPAEVRLGALAVLTLVSFYVCWRLARPFLGPLAWAALLAIVTRPVHRRIAARVEKPGLAAGLSVAVITLALVIPVAGVAAAIVHEARKGMKTLESGDVRGRWEALKTANPRFRPLLEIIEGQARSAAGAAKGQEPKAEERAGSQPPQSAGGSGGRGVLPRTVRAGMEFLITLFALFFFFRDADRVVVAVRDSLPLTRRRAQRVLDRVADAVWATTYGTMVVATVQGILGGLMFWALGLPAPVLWGVVMALLALVPVLGPFVVWVPAAAFLALEGSWPKAIALTLFGAVVIGLVDNVLYPSLVGGRMRLHTLVVFISMLGGLSVFGASGLFMGPALVTLALELRRAWSSRPYTPRPSVDPVSG